MFPKADSRVQEFNSKNQGIRIIRKIEVELYFFLSRCFANKGKQRIILEISEYSIFAHIKFCADAW